MPQADAHKVEVQMSSKLDITMDEEEHITHLNEYEMGKVLGQGAYGIVYLATGPQHGEVAVKVLNRSVLGLSLIHI